MPKILNMTRNELCQLLQYARPDRQFDNQTTSIADLQEEAIDWMLENRRNITESIDLSSLKQQHPDTVEVIDNRPTVHRFVTIKLEESDHNVTDQLKPTPKPRRHRSKPTDHDNIISQQPISSISPLYKKFVTEPVTIDDDNVKVRWRATGSLLV